MKAVEILAEEHRLLFRALDCFERLLDETTRSARLDVAIAAEIVEFLEQHIDGCHQDKEEEVLFPKLMENTTAEQGALVRELLGVHECERGLLDELRGHLMAAAGGDDPSGDEFVRRGRVYVDLQRSHAERENSSLLPLAEQVLGRADDAEMLVGFRKLEERYFGSEPCDPSQAVDALSERLDASSSA